MRSVPIGLLLVSILAGGCEKAVSSGRLSQPTGPAVLPDTADNGPRYTLKGQFRWKGELPKPPVLPAVFGKIEKLAPPLNSYYPAVDAKTSGLANVVVWLKLGEKIRKAPSRRDLRLAVEPNRLSFGESKSPVAVTSVGSELEMLSRAEGPTTVAARGAAFYTMAFPTAGTVHRRPFERTGTVDYFVASGDYWANGRVYIFDHPWFAITDSKGEFAISDVPLGTHELTWAAADYRLEKYERDPDTQAITRLIYREPIRSSRTLKVNADRNEGFEVGVESFR